MICISLKTQGKALYSCMLNHSGGVIDGLIAYYLAPNYYRLVVNAATCAKDLNWLQQQLDSEQLTIELREDLAIIAVQGPQALSKFIAARAELSPLISKLNRFACVNVDSWLIARTGYTGEDGLEIILPAAASVELWQALLQQGIKPVGLGARDTLRLEAGLNLYGNDMDETVSPFAANLAWTVAMEPNSRNFIGREALQQQLVAGILQELIAIVLNDKGVLRHGQKIYVNNQVVGIVTSGTFSPTLHTAIGFARVATPIVKQYSVDIRGKQHAVSVIKPPFVKNGHANFSIN